MNTSTRLSPAEAEVGASRVLAPSKAAHTAFDDAQGIARRVLDHGQPRVRVVVVGHGADQHRGGQGEEDTAIRQPLAAAIADTDGSESIKSFGETSAPDARMMSEDARAVRSVPTPSR